jgi:hypothetical protein
MPGFARFGLPLSAKLTTAEARALAVAFSTLAMILAFAVLHTLAGVGGKRLDQPSRGSEATSSGSCWTRCRI